MVSQSRSDSEMRDFLLQANNAENAAELEKALNDKLTIAGVQRAGEDIISLTID